MAVTSRRGALNLTPGAPGCPCDGAAAANDSAGLGVTINRGRVRLFSLQAGILGVGRRVGQVSAPVVAWARYQFVAQTSA